MAVHSYVKIWVHLIWGTHGREKIISEELRKKLFDHLIQRSKEIKIHIDKLYINLDHVHMLVELPSTRGIDEIARLLKGESSHWISQNDLTPFKFKWQRGYGAFSVSASQLNMVRRYIENQDEHHRRKCFQEE